MTISTRKNQGSHLYIAAAALVAVVVLAMYFYRFHGLLSFDSKDWADFGTFVGGLLGPSYAFLAFVVGIRTLQQMQGQSRRDEILKAIHSCEAEYERCAAMPVTCNAPWIWGNGMSDAGNVTDVSLRALLSSDGIDWERHLPQLCNGLRFRQLPSGELIQDRDVFMQAYLSLQGLYQYVNLYKTAYGDESLVQYFLNKYEIANNRIQIAMEISCDQSDTNLSEDQVEP